MPPRRFTAKRALAFLGVGSVAAIGAVASFPQLTAKQPVLGNDPRLASSLATIADASVNPNSIPTRAEAIAKLRQGTSASPFDILVVGGGATGSAVALDAASRGMRVALVEKGDFAGETSSKSTKLIHGGVRYLEKAVFGCDFKQLKLVFEALSERGVLLRQAPHLCHTLPTVIPCYSYFDAGFYWAGMKAYDVLAAVGGAMLSPSKFIGREETLEVLPSLRRERATEPRSPLVGSIVYYDGSMNDARLNLGAALTAAALGGVISNYLEVTKIQPIGSAGHPLSRVTVKDVRTGEAFDVHSRLVVSAAGPYTDKVLNSIDVGQAAADAPPPRSTIVPSAGAHVTLPAFLTRPANPSAETVALLVPQTSDGRVLFVAPWCGATIAGTTDRAVTNVENPTATQDDINFVLQSVSEAFEVPLTQNDLTSVWCGIRPLAAAFEGDGSTQSVVREHRIVTGENGIASVSGGKWTTFRRMGFDTVEAVIGSRADPELTKQFSAAVSSSLSSMLPFVGSPRWSDDSRLHAASDFGRRCKRADVTRETEEHLWTTYGIRAHSVLEIATRAESEKRWPATAAASSSGGGWFGSKKAKDSAAPSAVRVTPAGTLDRVLPSYPILSAEVVYAARHEMCVTPADFLCRRTRLAFVDAKAALAAVPKVTAILADEHKWSPERAKAEAEAAVTYINTFVPPPQRTPLQTAADRNKQHGSVVVAPSTA